MCGQSDYHYLPVDDRVVEWGLYLTSAGRVLDSVSTDMPHGVHPKMYMFDQSFVPRDVAITSSSRESGRILPEFAVILITDSHAVFETEETGVIEFREPSLIFLFPGIWHRYRPVGTEKRWLTSRWICFHGELAYRLMNRQSITPETAFRTAARPRRLAAAFDRLVERVSANPTADPVLLSMHVMDLLANCIDSAQSGTSMRDKKNTQDSNEIDQGSEKLVARMLELIWTGSHRDLTMDQLCDSVGVKRRSMERWFPATRGHSLLTEVNLCRCRRARNFLETTDLPIKNICWLAGFRNPAQMRMNFLHLVGTLPDQYRENHRQNRHSS
jgi:AraC-like DNA-binding protein